MQALEGGGEAQLQRAAVEVQRGPEQLLQRALRGAQQVPGQEPCSSCQVASDQGRAQDMQPGLALVGCGEQWPPRTFSAAATFRTDSVAAPPLAAKPDTPAPLLAPPLLAALPPGSPLVPAVGSLAGARLSPATQLAYEPARHGHSQAFAKQTATS